MRVLVDTDVVSYAYRKDDPFESFFGPRLVGHSPHIAFMTLAELEFGMQRRNWGAKRQNDLRDFVAARFVELSATRETCFQWGRLKAEAERRGRQLKSADGWIAATAVTYGLPLMTNNRRDFDFLPDLQLITQGGGS